MWESLFGSAITPAVQAGIGETAVNTVLPELASGAIDAGVSTALTGGLSNVGLNTLGQTLPQGVMQGAGQGMFSSLGNFGNALMSDQGANAFKALGQGYGLYNQGQALNNAQDIQNRQLKMSEGAYNRDKTADERRQKLVF